MSTEGCDGKARSQVDAEDARACHIPRRGVWWSDAVGIEQEVPKVRNGDGLRIRTTGVSHLHVERGQR